MVSSFLSDSSKVGTATGSDLVLGCILRPGTGSDLHHGFCIQTELIVPGCGALPRRRRLRIRMQPLQLATCDISAVHNTCAESSFGYSAERLSLCRRRAEVRLNSP